MRKFLTILFMTLLAYAAGYDVGWAAEGDVHDMNVTQNTLLNNNATIPTINIAQQSYPISSVTINWRYNKPTNNVVTIEVKVGGTSWGTQSVGTNTTSDAVFEGTATTGAVEIIFTNNAGSGTGKGTFYVNSVKLTEGSSGGGSSVTKPTIKINGNTFTDGTTFENPATLTITGDSGNSFYYTSGTSEPSDPTSSSTPYSSGVSYSTDGHYYVKAIAYDGNNASAVASADFIIATKYTVTCASGLSHGSISSDKATAFAGETVTITANPDAGYALNEITVNGSAITGNTFTMPAGNVNVSATFTKSTTATATFVVNVDKTSAMSMTKNEVTVTITGGTFDRTDNYRVYSGQSMTISVPSGYTITSIVFGNLTNSQFGEFDGYNTTTDTWTGSASSVTFDANQGAQVRFETITVTYSAPATGDHDITVTQATGGTIHAMMNGSAVSSASENDVVTLSATANDGYTFGSWSVTDSNDDPVTVNNNNGTYTFVMPDDDVTVTATFTKVTYTISKASMSNGDVSWSGTPKMDETITVTPTASSGYKVNKVYYNDGSDHEITPQNGVYSFTMPAGNVTVWATFQPGDLYVIGNTLNGLSNWDLTKGVLMNYDNNTHRYVANVYVAGENNYLQFAQGIPSGSGNETAWGSLTGRIMPDTSNGVNVDVDKYNGDPLNMDGTEPLSLTTNDTNASFWAPAGVYTLSVDLSQMKLYVTKHNYTLTFSPAEGDVDQGTSVTASCAQLVSDIAAIDANATVTVGVNTDNGSTWNASETLSTVGSATVYGRAAIGNIAVTGTASYTVQKADNSRTFQMITSMENDLIVGKKYLLVSESGSIAHSGTSDVAESITIEGHKTTLPANSTVNIFTLGKETIDDVDYYNFSFVSGGNTYYLANTSTDNGNSVSCETSLTDNGRWNISAITSTGANAGYVTMQSKSYNRYMRGYSGGHDFRAYSANTNGQAIQLYKQSKVGDFHISYAEVTGGSASGASDADAGDEITVTLTAGSGYAPNGITVTGVDANDITDNGNGTYTFTMPTQNVTVTPSFATAYALTYVNKYIDINGDEQTGDNGGTVSGPASEIEGANVSVTVTPESDYKVQSVVYTWASGSRDITEGLSFQMPGSATTVTATFVKKPFNISVSSSDGEVSGMPATAVSGQEVTFTVTPNAGYVVSGVSGTFNNGNGTLNITDNGNRTYTFNMPASDVAITVTYFASEDYELLTDLADINYEDNYLIVAGDDGTNYKKEGETVQVLSGVNSNIGTNVAATLGENGILSSTAAMKTVTFSAGSTTGTYKMYIAANGYVKTTDGNSLEVSNDVSDAADLTLVVTANADTIKLSNGRVLRFNTNTSSHRFCFYNSATGQVIRIFKLANQNKVKRPSITGDAGQYLGIYNFIGKDSVSLACATEGATIEYSLDGGTTWTAYDAAHRPEISTNAAGNTVSVMARATKTGMEASDAVTATFTCVAPTWHTKPCGDNWACKDTIFNNPVFIYPICSLANRNAYGKANCQFFYTTNGTTPTLASTELPVPSSGEKFLFLDQDVELTMIPVINGIAGEPVTGLIYFEPAAPVITLASGSYGGDQKTQLRTDTKTQHKGASWITKIYYFVETTSNTYEAFTFNAETGEPTAAAIAAGWQLYQPGTSPYVDILLANGEMQDLHAVTLTNFYAAPFDGTYSDASRTLNGTWTLSKESVASYTLTTAPLDVIFSPAGGNYLYAKDVVLTPVNSIGGATIYYTTDGTEPTTASAVYSAPIHVGPGSTTIKVYAVDNRMDATGGTFTKEYTYNIGVQEPLFSPFPGDYPGNGATKWGRQFKGVNEGDVTVEIFDVTPNAEIHYTYTEELTNSDHENFTYTEPADPTRSSTAYTEPIALKPGYTYIFKAIAYVGNQASPIRTRAFTVDQITSSEAAGYWMNVKAMNEETSTSTAKKFANPIEVIYMSTWRNSGNKPEYCFIRDNSGYGLVYFGGKDVTAYNGYTIFNPGDWLPGNSVGGKVSVWSESYINELGSSSGSITAWPTTAMANRAIIPETTTCQAIRDGWTYKVDGKPASISGDKAVYKQYVDPVNNKFGHYVHLRKNKITNVVRTGNNLTTENPGKLSGIITGELGTPLQYYDGFYLFSGYNGATAKTQDDFNAIQDKGGTFDVYAVVQFYGSNTTNSTYSYAPYEVFPIAFDHIFPPIFNLAGDGTAADMTNDNPERTRYEATTLTLSCETRGAVIMYKTSDMEDFAVYNGEIINVDKTMTIETYSLHSTEHFDQLESKVRTLTINMGSVEQPEISPESVMRAIGGEAVNASISCDTEGATIWYTTDGSDPRDDTNAGRYEYNAGGSNPALTGISSTTTVRAIAEADGFYSVEAEPKTYTFVKSNGIVYDLVTSEADLKEGAIYVIVSKEYNMAMQRSQKENNRDQSPVLFLQPGDEGYVAENTKVYGNDDLAIFTLHKFAGTGPNWTLHTSNGVNNASIGYLYGQASGSTNQLKTEFTLDNEGKTEAYIEIDSDGTAHISFVKPDEPRYLRYNHSFNLFNSYTNESTGDPVYLYKKDAFPLANIEKKGVKDQQYTVADELVGVYAVHGILWAKDQGNVSIDKREIGEGQEDYMGSRMNIAAWDQSNWIALQFTGTDAVAHAAAGVGKFISAATVQGVYTDDVNYTLKLPEGTGLSLNGDAGFTQDNVNVNVNVYGPANFNVANFMLSDLYFVNPKVQEVAKIVWAVWKDGMFVIPAKGSGNGQNNLGDLDGAVAIGGWQYNSTGQDMTTALNQAEANTFEFLTVIQKPTTSEPTPAPSTKSVAGDGVGKPGQTASPDYVLYPLTLTADSGVVTGIDNVGGSVKEVKSVRVYNVAGVEQRELQPGVNIVVTTYTDGTRSTAKVLR